VIPPWPWEYVELVKHAVAEFEMTLEYEDSSSNFQSREEWDKERQEQLHWVRRNKRSNQKCGILRYWEPGIFSGDDSSSDDEGSLA
jgi:hypothetical protein